MTADAFDIREQTYVCATVQNRHSFEYVTTTLRSWTFGSETCKENFYTWPDLCGEYITRYSTEKMDVLLVILFGTHENAPFQSHSPLILRETAGLMMSRKRDTDRERNKRPDLLLSLGWVYALVSLIPLTYRHRNWNDFLSPCWDGCIRRIWQKL